MILEWCIGMYWNDVLECIGKKQISLPRLSTKKMKDIIAYNESFSISKLF